jgi:hypothetical protein
MADSENSRTLSPVTRRGLLSGTAVWLTEQIANMSPDCDAIASGGIDERVLCIWRKWMAAHRKVEQFCRAQQRLERRLVTAIGFPRVEILAADMERPVVAFTADKIDSLLGGGTETAEVRREARALLQARQQVWDAMDERLGYSRARRVEAEAEVHRDELAEALWVERAQSVAGIVAKLHAVLLRFEDDGPHDEPPWPQIRSILMDLTRLDATRSGRSDA